MALLKPDAFDAGCFFCWHANSIHHQSGHCNAIILTEFGGLLCRNLC